jgi:hypothetical protein
MHDTSVNGSTRWRPITRAGVLLGLGLCATAVDVHASPRFLDLDALHEHEEDDDTGWFIQLPSGGSGYYTLAPPEELWGVQDMVFGLADAADAWDQTRLAENLPRLGVGDISLAEGGWFPPHKNHRCGIDVDLRPIGKTPAEEPLLWTDPEYSRKWTATLVDDYLLANLPAERIYFNDPQLIGGIVEPRPDHDNHLHLRIVLPFGFDCDNQG